MASGWSYTLNIIAGRYQGGTFPLRPNREIVIGRGSEYDMVLEEEMVSRRHARITTFHGRIVVEDLGSTNGTFLNGERLEGRAIFSVGDRLQVGRSLMELTSATAAQPAHSPAAPPTPPPQPTAATASRPTASRPILAPPPPPEAAIAPPARAVIAPPPPPPAAIAPPARAVIAPPPPPAAIAPPSARVVIAPPPPPSAVIAPPPPSADDLGAGLDDPFSLPETPDNPYARPDHHAEAVDDAFAAALREAQDDLEGSSEDLDPFASDEMQAALAAALAADDAQAPAPSAGDLGGLLDDPFAPPAQPPAVLAPPAPSAGDLGGLLDDPFTQPAQAPAVLAPPAPSAGDLGGLLDDPFAQPAQAPAVLTPPAPDDLGGLDDPFTPPAQAPTDPPIEEAPLALLTAAQQTARSGLLELSCEDGSVVQLLYQGGVLTHLRAQRTAEDPEVLGMKALQRTLAQPTARALWQPLPPDAPTAPLFDDLNAALAQAQAEQEQLAQYTAYLPAQTAQLALNLPLQPALSALSAEVLDTLQLVLNFGQIARVLDHSAATDLETTQDLLYLMQNGYLRAENEARPFHHGAT